MATAAKSKPPAMRRRWLRSVLFWIALAAVAALVWYWRPLTANAVTATSYGARVACPCRFIAERALSDCRDDFEPGMGFVILSADVEAQSVTAWIPLVSSQTATFREGQGCQLEPWDD